MRKKFLTGKKLGFLNLLSMGGGRQEDLMRMPACSVCGVAETRQIHVDYRGLWRKRDGTATLSRGERPNPCLDRLFYWLNLHRNTGFICKAHQSWSGRNDEIMDNIQRTLRAYSEPGSYS